MLYAAYNHLIPENGNFMQDDYKTNLCNLTGEIIEIYEKDKTRFAKIKYDPGFIEVCIDKITDAHLNDKLIISSNIHIKNIFQNIEGNNFK